MPRKNCPARDGQPDSVLAIVDAFDVPACLVLGGRAIEGRTTTLPDRDYGPCVDCLPTPTLREALAARWRRVKGRLHGRG